MDFFNNLKEACDQNGTTPTAVCKELGLSTSLPTKWKNGVEPNIGTVGKIADHLGISVTELIEGKPQGSFFLGLTDEESRIIEAYRAASAERKESVCLLLGVEVERKTGGQDK